MIHRERERDAVGEWNEWDGKQDIEDGGLRAWRKRDVLDVAKE